MGLAACGSDTPSSTTGEATVARGGEGAVTGAAEGGDVAKNGDRASGAGSPSAASPAEPAGKAEVAPREPQFTPRRHHDSGGGSQQFETKGGDNSIPEYGDEASGPEFDEAAAALHNYLDARAAGVWSVACEYIAPAVTEELVQQLGSAQGGKQPDCAVVLAGLFAGVPAAALREAAVANVAALRVEGEAAFLLFHGARGDDFFIPMHRENGGWKAAAIAPSGLP